MLCKDRIKLLAVLAASDTYNPFNLAVPNSIRTFDTYIYYIIRYINNDSTLATSLVIK